MQSNPPTSSLSINLDELTAYKHITAFNLFFYSRSPSNTPIFLLYRSSNSPKYSHYSGSFTKHDPNIFFAIAREFITKTRGLLHTLNLTQLLAESSHPVRIDKMIFEQDLTGIVRPQKGFTSPIDDICKLLCECSLIFQDETDTASYFIELPHLSIPAIQLACKAKGLKFEMKYFSLSDIIESETEISPEFTKCLENQKLNNYIHKYIVNLEPIETTGHYAFITCDAGAKSSMLPSIHYSIYKKHGEKWRYYRAYEGEFPTDEDLKHMNGIIIPGSGHRAYDTTVPWYPQLFERICKIIREHPSINFLGFCFGAQIAAQALGGKVEKMNRDFIRGGDLLKLEPTFYELEYLRDLGLDLLKPVVMGQAHGDHIVKLPEGAICHASSANTKIEIFTIGNNLLGIQGHPEFNEPWTAGSNYRMMRVKTDNYDEYAEEYIKKTFPIPIPRDHILKICYTFLKKKAKEGEKKV